MRLLGMLLFVLLGWIISALFGSASAQASPDEPAPAPVTQLLSALPVVGDISPATAPLIAPIDDVLAPVTAPVVVPAAAALDETTSAVRTLPATKLVHHAVEQVARTVAPQTADVLKPVGALIQHVTAPLTPVVEQVARPLTPALSTLGTTVAKPVRTVSHHVSQLVPSADGSVPPVPSGQDAVPPAASHGTGGTHPVTTHHTPAPAADDQPGPVATAPAATGTLGDLAPLVITGDAAGPLHPTGTDLTGIVVPLPAGTVTTAAAPAAPQTVATPAAPPAGPEPSLPAPSSPAAVAGTGGPSSGTGSGNGGAPSASLSEFSPNVLLRLFGIPGTHGPDGTRDRATKPAVSPD